MPATLLQIDDISFVDWAVRGINMTLAPIEQARDLRRDVNGNLLDLSLVQFQKYRSTISCRDQAAPVLNDVWPGKLVTVTFIPGVGVVNTTDDALTLQMRVMSWNTSVDEYAADVAWELELEQV